MLNKNTPGVKKARPSRKHHAVSSDLAMHSTKKCDIWWRPSPKQFASNNVRSITYKFQKVQSLILDVQQFEQN